ncbi:MAG: hypothetical protein ACK500_01105, partial [Flavobacteriales bacterium]
MRKRYTLRATWIAAILLFFSGLLTAQQDARPWYEKMEDPAVNYFDVQESFRQEWLGKPIERGKGWKQFQR